jgi:AraC-like DNA-binding protein
MARQFSIDAICRLIDALLPEGYPAIENVAQLLYVSPRTLQRLLNEEGVSYSYLVERCRCKIACESLEQTRKPIREIAATLGYADASSFARAFRRWTGTAPFAYRNQSLGRQGNRSNQTDGDVNAIQ